MQLIHQLAHGNTMTSQDEDRIIPMLSVYTTMLRFALFSIYDTDFYSGLFLYTVRFSFVEKKNNIALLKDLLTFSSLYDVIMTRFLS